jgi:hypothetical protein
VKTHSSLRLRFYFAAGVLLSGIFPCAAAKLTAATQIWRVTDTANNVTYYAESIETGWFAMSGGARVRPYRLPSHPGRAK